MDIFDRLGNLIRTIIDDESSGISAEDLRDPDQRAAWEELEEYMQRDSGASGSDASRDPLAAPQMAMPPSLRRDFRNLEVPVGAPLPEVRQAYKRLMAAFHPDRHADNPEKLKTATEVTKKLNQSFQRIRTWYEAEAGNRS